MNNKIEFEFKKGVLFIDIKIKITIINFGFILMKIYKIQSINKFRYIAIKFKENKTNELLLWFLQILVLDIDGNLMVLNDKKDSKNISKKYYVVSDINYVFDIFSIIV